jgi:heme exporter protein CcmD
MPTLDKYAPYIFAAYGVAIVALAGLVLWTAWRAVQAKRKLDAAEAGDQKEAQP